MKRLLIFNSIIERKSDTPDIKIGLGISKDQIYFLSTRQSNRIIFKSAFQPGKLKIKLVPL